VLDFPVAGVDDFTALHQKVRLLPSSEVEITKEGLPRETEIWVLKHAK
jgi:hypothetical protein